MEWTGGILVSIRAELDKEKLGVEHVATVCVHTCVCARLCGVCGCGYVRVWCVYGFVKLPVLYFTQIHSGVFPL